MNRKWPRALLLPRPWKLQPRLFQSTQFLLQRILGFEAVRSAGSIGGLGTRVGLRVTPPPSQRKPGSHSKHPKKPKRFQGEPQFLGRDKAS